VCSPPGVGHFFQGSEPTLAISFASIAAAARRLPADDDLSNAGFEQSPSKVFNGVVVRVAVVVPVPWSAFPEASTIGIKNHARLELSTLICAAPGRRAQGLGDGHQQGYLRGSP